MSRTLEWQKVLLHLGEILSYNHLVAYNWFLATKTLSCLTQIVLRVLILDYSDYSDRFDLYINKSCIIIENRFD